MKKTGFTLTEVLITLGIVGVIAALTIPALNQNVSQKSIGPSLSKAISNLNAANNDYLSSAGVHKLNAGANNYIDVLSATMNGVLDSVTTTNAAGEDTTTRTFYSADGISYTEKDNSWQPAKGKYNRGNEYTGANGASLSCRPGTSLVDRSTTYSEEAACYDLDKKYGNQYAEILIDVNGNKGNGALGYEKFRVYVDTKGYIIPGGSQEAVDYLDSVLAHAVKTNDDCSANASVDCTAAIMQNGWVVDY